VPRTIPLAKIRRDGGTQSREGLNGNRVAYLAEIVRMGGKFDDAVRVTFDGTHCWLTDGFHRVAAALMAGLKEIEAEIVQGTQQDAQWESLAANKDHKGLPRTREDMHRAIDRAIALRPDHGDRAIAKHVGCSHVTVAARRPASPVGQVDQPEPTKRTGSDGKSYRAHKPKRDPKPKAPESKSANAPPPAPRPWIAPVTAPTVDDADEDVMSKEERDHRVLLGDVPFDPDADWHHVAALADLNVSLARAVRLCPDENVGEFVSMLESFVRRFKGRNHVRALA